MEFKERLARLHEHFGSQEKLARELGVSLMSIHRWESGKGVPKQEVVHKALEMLEKKVFGRAAKRS